MSTAKEKMINFHYLYVRYEQILQMLNLRGIGGPIEENVLSTYIGNQF